MVWILGEYKSDGNIIMGRGVQRYKRLNAWNKWIDTSIEALNSLRRTTRACEAGHGDDLKLSL